MPLGVASRAKVDKFQDFFGKFYHRQVLPAHRG